MCFLSFFPSSKIVNRHKIYIQVKDIYLFFQNVFIWWTIIIISCNSLSFIRIQIIQIFRRYLSGSFFIYYRIYDSYGRLSQNADTRCHNFVIIRIIFYRKISFVFPCDQDISLSIFYEGSCCAPCSGIQYKYVCIKFLDKKNPEYWILDFVEVPPGFEPGIEVLQTFALPLGYGTIFNYSI